MTNTPGTSSGTPSESAASGSSRTEEPRRPALVVGVDGSDSSINALRWALHEAVLRRGSVRALHTWTYPAGYGVEMAAVSALDPKRLDASAHQTLEEAIGKATVGIDAPPAIERVVRSGSPGRELIAEGAGAELLVVGARGHGGFVGLLLGSVATQVVNHAPCPVVVVPRAEVWQ